MRLLLLTACCFSAAVAFSKNGGDPAAMPTLTHDPTESHTNLIPLEVGGEPVIELQTNSNGRVHGNGSPITSGTDELNPHAEDGFTVEAQGTGSMQGLAYTVPAHAKGRVTADLQIQSLTSEDVKTLNDLIMSFLSASHREEVKDTINTSTQANLSLFSFFGAGVKTSVDTTHSRMESLGLTNEHIQTIIEKFADSASKMSKAGIDLEVDNTCCDYATSGSMLLYTIAGKVYSGNKQYQYRMLADRGGTADGAAAKSAAQGGQGAGIVDSTRPVIDLGGRQ